jgi:hypothetical protein
MHSLIILKTIIIYIYVDGFLVNIEGRDSESCQTEEFLVVDGFWMDIRTTRGTPVVGIVRQ